MPLPFPPVDSWTHESWLSRNSTIYWTMIQRACSLVENFAPALGGIDQGGIYQAGTAIESSMAIPTFCQVSFFEDGGNMVRPVNFVSIGSFSVKRVL